MYKQKPRMPEHTSEVQRRDLIKGFVAMAAGRAVRGIGQTSLHSGAPVPQHSGVLQPYSPAMLPEGVRSRFVQSVNGARMHVLEAGYEQRNRPIVVLLHGFPDLAYCWRKVMPDLSAAGFHVIAPDLRGYGRSSGTNVKYDDGLSDFRTLNMVTDVAGLVSAMGSKSVAAVVGHDFGSPLAAWCALIRPDVFHRLVMMSAPFGGPPALPFDTADAPDSEAIGKSDSDAIYQQLAELVPPRKHYQQYYTTRAANENMWHAPQGEQDFLRAYFYMKSADWEGNKPHPLKAWTAEELAQLPRYYVMDLNKGMAETVAPAMPSPAQITACRWLSDQELNVYVTEYARTGFQGGLQGYRVGFDRQNTQELRLFSGRKINVPSLFIAGESDWGVYQRPGALEKMQHEVCTHMYGVHLVTGAGHWVQQEQPEEVNRLLLGFLQAS
jgi:pimeloyl-ACP methyl ester carboxylesterase